MPLFSVAVDEGSRAGAAHGQKDHAILEGMEHDIAAILRHHGRMRVSSSSLICFTMSLSSPVAEEACPASCRCSSVMTGLPVVKCSMITAAPAASAAASSPRHSW